MQPVRLYSLILPRLRCSQRIPIRLSTLISYLDILQKLVSLSLNIAQSFNDVCLSFVTQKHRCLSCINARLGYKDMHAYTDGGAYLIVYSMFIQKHSIPLSMYLYDYMSVYMNQRPCSLLFSVLNTDLIPALKVKGCTSTPPLIILVHVVIRMLY